MMTARHLSRASLLVAACAAFALGCVQEPPRTLIIGNSSEGTGGSGDGTGGSGAVTSTTGVGAGDAVTTGVGAGTTTSTGAGAGTSTSAGTGGHQQQGTFDLAVDDDAPSADLLDQTSIQVTLTPEMGFTGTVNLGASGLPAGVTAVFDDDTPYVAGSPKDVGVTLKTSESVPVGDVDFTITANAGSISHESPVTLTVNPTITLHIPQGVLNLGTPENPYKTAYGPYPMVIHAQGNMITVNFMNDDNQSHQIHSGGAFGHDPGSIPAHQMDSFVRHVPQGQYDWYLHDQGSAATPGQMIVQ
ncbi:MAG TPA: hypothetical protein VHB21_23480 [Minicystis sp.]|nr:hypothetical protein [Minicystis sp.]